MIQPFHAIAPRKVRGTDVKAGQKCFAVRKGDLYFIWSYANESYAHRMDTVLEAPESSIDIAANWRRSPLETIVSGRTKWSQS